MADKTTRLSLKLILLLAFVIRAYVVMTQVYVIYPDEIFQYFEQGHRLAFGSGIKPWEYFDGTRSWLLPGLIAGVMRLANVFSDDPMLYVRLVKLCCVVLSLSVVYVGFRYGLRLFGLTGAVIVGFVCAVWFELIYFSPAVLTEVLAAHLIVLAVYLGDPSAPPENEKWLVVAGLLFGLAIYLRVQYLPAAVVAAVWQNRLAWRRYVALTLGGLGILLPLGGVLDALTWSTPFHPMWMNVVRNGMENYGSLFGRDPWYYYFLFEGAAWRFASILGVFALFGAVRAPLLAVICAVTLVTHSVVPHKEQRFVYLVLAYAPILIGLGISSTVSVLDRHFGALWARCGTGALLLLVSGLSLHSAIEGLLGPRWQSERPDVDVFRLAHAMPDLCGLGVDGVEWVWTGGYTYLNREVPLYLWDYGPRYGGHGLRSQAPMNLAVVLHGQPIQQFAHEEFSRRSDLYNYLVGGSGNAPAGYSTIACFHNSYNAWQPADICLFRRPGRCS